MEYILPLIAFIIGVIVGFVINESWFRFIRKTYKELNKETIKSNKETIELLSKLRERI